VNTTAIRDDLSREFPLILASFVEPRAPHASIKLESEIELQSLLKQRIFVQATTIEFCVTFDQVKTLTVRNNWIMPIKVRYTG
jgi:hypothetical protein